MTPYSLRPAVTCASIRRSGCIPLLCWTQRKEKMPRAVCRAATGFDACPAHSMIQGDEVANGTAIIPCFARTPNELASQRYHCSIFIAYFAAAPASTMPAPAAAAPDCRALLRAPEKKKQKREESQSHVISSTRGGIKTNKH